MPKATFGRNTDSSCIAAGHAEHVQFQAHLARAFEGLVEQIDLQAQASPQAWQRLAQDLARAIPDENLVVQSLTSEVWVMENSVAQWRKGRRSADYAMYQPLVKEIETEERSVQALTFLTNPKGAKSVSINGAFGGPPSPQQLGSARLDAGGAGRVCRQRLDPLLV